MNNSLQERRKAPRFQGNLVVELAKGVGATSDFSTSGIYFETDQPFPPADPLEFSMKLEHTGLGPQSRVRCHGEVVRVEPMGERVGVAVTIRSYGFEELRDPGQG